MPVTTGKTTTQSSSPSRGPGGGSLQAPNRTQPSVAASQTKNGSVASSKGPGASQAAAKASSVSKSAAPAAKPSTGSGAIGSKGGGASTQKPGAGGTGLRGPGYVSTPRNDYNKMANAFSRPTPSKSSPPAATKPAAAKPVVGQGFINSKTSALRDQYAQYRSPPGITQQKPAQPTVKGGASYTNPKGVPDSVAKALAARGYNPDGTKMAKPPVNGIISRNPYDRTREIQQDRARLNDDRKVIARNPYDVTKEVQKLRNPTPANTVLARNPYDRTKEVQQERARANDERRVIARNPFDVTKEVQKVRGTVPQPSTPKVAQPDAASLLAQGYGQYRQPPSLTRNLPTNQDLYNAIVGLPGQAAAGLGRAWGGVQDYFAGTPAPATMNTTGLVNGQPGFNPGMAFAPPAERVQKQITDRVLPSDPTGLVQPGTPQAKYQDRILPSMPTATGEEVIAPRVPQRRGGLTQDEKRQAAALQMRNARARGVSIQPMSAEIDIPGQGLPVVVPEQYGGVGAVRLSGLADPSFNTAGRVIGDTTRRAGLDRFGNIGGEMVGTLGNRGVRTAAPAKTAQKPFRNAASEGMPQEYMDKYPNVQAPSQEYDGAPDVNPSQNDGQPGSFSELRNRYNYEKQKVKDGVRSLPSRIAQAIRDGDFRQWQGPIDGGGGKGQGMDRPQSQAITPTADPAMLLEQLRAALAAQELAKQQAGQMDLVFKTFV